MIFHSQRMWPVAFLTLIAWSQPAYLRANTISYLRFEEGSGFTAADETGLMDGELLGDWGSSEGWTTDVPTSVIPQTGQPNTQSIRFGGGSEFVDLSNANDVYLGYSFTIEYFFKAEEPVIQSLFFSLTGGSSIAASISSPRPDILLGLSFLGTSSIIGASNVSYNAWQHLALVKQPGEYQVYIDGELIADESLSSETDGPYSFAGTSMTGDRTIGGDDGTFRGWIDEFRISDEALTPNQFLCAIPEPSTMGLLLLGAAGLAWRKRRK